ncbi:MAG: hypothetical protein H7175_17190, partial [Burkholderiales bacterium]|nr:hypothetical protein [Anaerolineae bacterium]
MTTAAAPIQSSVSHRARRRALQIGLFALLCITLFCAFTLMNNGGDPLDFARVGTMFSSGAYANMDGTKGYDGQFGYYIARDGANAVPYIDGPTLRFQRILYPLTVRALSLGQPELIAWMLIVVNVLAHSIGAALITYLIVSYNAPVIGGVIYALWIGAVIAVRMDLNEPLCFALALGALVAYRHERYRWTILLLMLSTISKELGLIFAAGIALLAFFNGKRRWAVLIFSGPLLLFLVWWGLMRLWLGRLPLGYPAAHLELIPLRGMFSETDPAQFLFLVLWLGIPSIVLLLLALRTIWKRRNIPLSAAVLLVAAGFVITMPDVSWEDPIAAYRVGMPLIIAGLLYTAQVYPRA